MPLTPQVKQFFYRALGVWLTVTRIRSIMHTECATTQSAERLKVYEVRTCAVPVLGTLLIVCPPPHPHTEG
jgi:hypothetical protein